MTLSPDALALTGLTQLNRWNLGAPFGTSVAVTYSFPTSLPGYDTGWSGFQPTTAQQQADIRQALATWGAACGITFVEVPPNIGGQIRFCLVDMAGVLNSVGQQASGYGYYPSWRSTTINEATTYSVGVNDIGGDVFLNASYYAGDSASFTPGTRGFSIVLHEIGHALGFKHPFEGEPTINSMHDSAAYTVMSYNRPSTTTQLGPVDIEAAQYYYGSQHLSTSFDVTTLTVTRTGTAASEWVLGTELNDVLNGLGGDDITPYHGLADQYSVVRFAFNAVRVSESIGGRDGSDTLTDIEHIHFADRSINLSMQAEATKVSAADLDSLIELYVAYFNRVPEAEGLKYWIEQRADGTSLADISARFYAAGIQYSQLTGYSQNMSNTDFAKVVYANVLGRTGTTAPTSQELAYWDNQIATGAVTKQGLIARMLSDAHAFEGDPIWGWVPHLLDNKVSIGRLHAVDLGVDYNSAADAIAQTVAVARAVTATDVNNAVALIGLADNVHLA